MRYSASEKLEIRLPEETGTTSWTPVAITSNVDEVRG